jgi:hypothetical protein
MSQGTFFERFSVFKTREQCAASADALERHLGQWLPAVRFREMREKLERWTALSETERHEFGAAMGWRQAVFLDDDWFWGELDFAGAIPAQPTRGQFQEWAVGQRASLHKLAEQQKLPDKANVIAEADRALALDFAYVSAFAHQSHREYVNWTISGRDVDNQEFIMPLRLTPHLRLAEGFSVTGDGRYLAMMVRLLADMLWVIPGNVVLSPDGKNPRTHWGLDALHVAIRTQNLIAMYALTEEAVDVEATTLMWKMLWLCGERCREFWHTKPHNIIFYEPAGLGMAGFYFPAFKSAKIWREAAQQRLIGALRGSIMSDGSNVEAAFGYHAAYLNSPQQILDAAEFSGLPVNPAFVETFRQRRCAILEFWAKIATPSRTLPPLGDASAYDLREPLERLGKAYGSDLARGVAAVDEPGRWPRERSFYLPVQRYAVMRSGWDKDALWCGFNLRGYHFGHDHYDLFHIELQGGASRLLVDTGCLDYDANRERSRASASHNTLVVDGQNNRAGAAADVRWHSNAMCDWVEGLSPACGGALHRRAVCFLKPDLFLVLDRVEPIDREAHQFDLYWHLPVGSLPEATVDSVCFSEPKGWSVALEFLSDGGWSVAQEEGLVTPICFAPPSKAPVVRFGSKRPGGWSAVTAVRATRPGGAPSAVRVEKPAVLVHNAADGEPVPEGRAVAARFGETTVFWCEPGYGEKIVGDWTTDADWLVARASADGKPTVLARNASMVTWKGRAVGWESV